MVKGLAIILIIVIVGILGFAIYTWFNPLYSVEDYCKDKYGDEYYYNAQKGQPYRLRSCDKIYENGTIEVKYFNYNTFTDLRNEIEKDKAK